MLNIRYDIKEYPAGEEERLSDNECPRTGDSGDAVSHAFAKGEPALELFMGVSDWRVFVLK
jgi:hypothetical protein